MRHDPKWITVFLLSITTVFASVAVKSMMYPALPWYVASVCLIVFAGIFGAIGAINAIYQFFR